MCNQMISIEAVAEKMQTTQLNVLMHIKRGLLAGQEKDGMWMIDSTSFEKLLTKTEGRKVENICASGCSKKHSCGGGCS